jgi:hypothetical protein
MSDFTDNIRTAYEHYLLGDKEKAFSLLIPGTKHHYYLSIIDALKHSKDGLSDETKKLVQDFRNNFNDSDVDRVWLQKLFVEYDAAKTDEERNKIIEIIDHDYVNGFYNHSKPVDVIGKKDNDGAAPQTQVFQQEKYFNEESHFKHIYESPDKLPQLHKTLINKVDFSKIPKSSFERFLQIDSFANISNDSFWIKLLSTWEKSFEEDKYFNPPAYLYDKMTLEQMEMIGSKLKQLAKDSNYIGKIFQKKFHFELDNDNKDNFTFEERREQLIAMYDDSKERPQGFRSALLLEILENGVKLDVYDKHYFLEYIQHPLKTWHLSKKQKEKGEHYDYVWNQYISSTNNRKGGTMDSGLDKKLYRMYLEHFFNQSKNLDEFKEYFDQDFLVDLAQEFEFMSGGEIVKDKVDTKVYEIMLNKVLIDILQCNKDVFKKEDRVKLVAEIKNVSTLYIKIFEFNCENYYRKNMKELDKEVNLDGLVTAFEDTLEFSEPPQKKFRHVFEFPQLDDKVGVFIIEFISNGYSSRAVINKGSLSLIYKDTLAGQVAYILDENRQI